MPSGPSRSSETRVPKNPKILAFGSPSTNFPKLSQPSTPDPESSTLNPRPSTLKSRPSTLDPRNSTNYAAGAGSDSSFLREPTRETTSVFWCLPRGRCPRTRGIQLCRRPSSPNCSRWISTTRMGFGALYFLGSDSRSRGAAYEPNPQPQRTHTSCDS